MAISRLPLALQNSINSKQVHARIPHLDGMRAVALSGVLLFHFKAPGFSGGFIGVDMFFTISGFLITRNILSELDAGTFSLLSFYKRRFFRLYPASLAVILATLLTSFIFIRPMYQEIISQSALASMTFWSNIFFHSRGEYFAEHFEMRPLLHFWSLSVEEQFYTFWPLLLMNVAKLRKPGLLKGVLWCVAALSFTFAAKIYEHHATFAFYEIPARVFQFAAGALLSIYLKDKERAKSEDNRNSSETNLSLTSPRDIEPEELFQNGMSPLSTFRPTTSYPRKLPEHINDFNDILSVAMTIVIILSFTLLPPSPHAVLIIPITIATCALIAIPNGVICEVVFSSSTLSHVGKLSYSIYLVHWPICVLGDYVIEASGVACPRVILFLLSVYLGSKLYHGIEQPMRYGSSVIKRALLYLFIAVTFTFALGSLLTGGYKFRFPEDGKTGWPSGTRRRYFWDVCLDFKDDIMAANIHPHVQTCRVGDVAGEPSNLYFFGDSFTGHLSVGLDAIGKKRGTFFDLRYVDYCGFRTMMHPRSQARASQGFPCADAVGSLWQQAYTLPNGSTIVVANWWGDPTNLQQTLANLRDKVHDAGKKLTVIAEPPAVAAKHKGYYACADIAVLPLGYLFQKGGERRGAMHCLDFDEGVSPGHTFADEQAVYRSAFASDGELNDSRLVNFFPHLCRRKLGKGRNGRSNYYCKAPASIHGVVHDIGYEPDMTHLTSVGSFNLSDILEYELFSEKQALPSNSSTASANTSPIASLSNGSSVPVANVSLESLPSAGTVFSLVPNISRSF